MHTAARLVLAAVMFVAAASAVFTSQDPLKDAAALGRTRDDAQFEAFNKSYSLTLSGNIERAEIVTEFRRAVLIVREKALVGDYQYGGDALAKALLPMKGLVTFIVQVRLHPQHAFNREPAYDLYVSTGSRSAPIASTGVKRQPVYPPGGGQGSPMVAVRLEASFPRTDFTRSAAPMLTVTDEQGETLWQAHPDLSRYR